MFFLDGQLQPAGGGFRADHSAIPVGAALFEVAPEIPFLTQGFQGLIRQARFVMPSAADGNARP